MGGALSGQRYVWRSCLTAIETDTYCLYRFFHEERLLPSWAFSPAIWDATEKDGNTVFLYRSSSSRQLQGLMAHSAHSASPLREYSYSHMKKKDWRKTEHKLMRNKLIQGEGAAD